MNSLRITDALRESQDDVNIMIIAGYTLKEIADFFKLPPKSVSRAFPRVFGTNYTEYRADLVNGNGAVETPRVILRRGFERRTRSYI